MRSILVTCTTRPDRSTAEEDKIFKTKTKMKMKMKILTTATLLATLGAAVAVAQEAKLDRTTLPIQPPEHKAITELYALEVVAEQHEVPPDIEAPAQ
jgi:hypothetical protein